MNRIFPQPQPERTDSQNKPRPISAVTSIQDEFARAKVWVDWARREIRHHDGRRCKLSALETALLACLAQRAGTPVSRDEILAQVWQLDPRCTATRTIDMHISFLRRKCGVGMVGPSILITVYRVGYMLQPGAISSEVVPPVTGAAGRVPWELLTGIESLTVA